MDFRVNIHQADDSIRQMANILTCAIDDFAGGRVRFVGINQQLHFQGLRVAADKLRDRCAQSRDGGLRVIGVPIDWTGISSPLMVSMMSAFSSIAKSCPSAPVER